MKVSVYLEVGLNVGVANRDAPADFIGTVRLGILPAPRCNLAKAFADGRQPDMRCRTVPPCGLRKTRVLSYDVIPWQESSPDCRARVLDLVVRPGHVPYSLV